MSAPPVPRRSEAERRQALAARLSRWAFEWRIAPLVAFLLEINRPLAPLSANAVVAFGPLLGGLAPLPVDDLVLLLQDDAAIRELCLQLRRGTPAAPGNAPTPPP
jgi:hypothetical protein